MDEVESLLGEAVASDPEPTSAGQIRSCSFKTERGGKFFLLQIYPQTTTEFDADRESNAADSTEISDLGDGAFFFSGMLRVHLGETGLQISTWHSRSKQDEALAMTQEIAEMAITRLP